MKMLKNWYKYLAKFLKSKVSSGLVIATILVALIAFSISIIALCSTTTTLFLDSPLSTEGILETKIYPKTVEILFMLLLVVVSLTIIILVLQISHMCKKVDPLTELDYDETRGIILRGRDLRHVLFSSHTLQRFMEDFCKDREDSNGLLKKVGFYIGEKFGQDFIEILMDEHKFNGRHHIELIDEWCEFDKRGGWGKLKQTNVNKDHTSANIEINNNFLIFKDSAKTQEDRVSFGFCGFLEGYIKGVLKELVGSTWTVEVTQNTCGGDSGDARCYFQYILNTVPQNTETTPENKVIK